MGISQYDPAARGRPVQFAVSEPGGRRADRCGVTLAGLTKNYRQDLAARLLCTNLFLRDRAPLASAALSATRCRITSAGPAGICVWCPINVLVPMRTPSAPPSGTLRGDMHDQRQIPPPE